MGAASPNKIFPSAPFALSELEEQYSYGTTHKRLDNVDKRNEMTLGWFRFLRDEYSMSADESFSQCTTTCKPEGESNEGNNDEIGTVQVVVATLLVKLLFSMLEDLLKS